MGKNKRKISKKNTKRTVENVITLIVFLILLIAGANYNKIKDVEATDNENNINNNNMLVQSEIKLQGDKNDYLEIYYFDVGQADSILLKHKNETMLIDAGTNETGSVVVKKLKELGIKKINYLVGTHPHEDHIGGLDDIIKNFEIEKIYMPKIQTNTKTFEDVLNAISDKGLKVQTPKVGSTFKIGDVECEIMLCGQGTDAEKENLNLSSIVIYSKYKEQSYLFTGDSETENESSRAWPKVNVLKVGHHGSTTSSSKKFLDQIKPNIAIIQVGAGNSYNHPHQKILDRLISMNTIIYRTDEKGTILIQSDGISNKILTEK